MVKFSDLLLVASGTDFRFIDQRTVRLFLVYNDEAVDYTLSKADVILAIRKYIKCVHFYSSDPICSEGVNFSAFKMYDLVPYLYTLVNLFLTKQNDLVAPYYRFLPELKLTCFCHLPFEEEIIVNEKPLVNIKYAILENSDLGVTQYVCLDKSGVPMAFSKLSDLEHALDILYPDYRIHLYCDLPF